jgi:hypothetical protein
VVNTTRRASPRWVRGKPNWAAAAQAAVTPGTTSTDAVPRRNAASSPTRPKIDGIAALQPHDPQALAGQAQHQAVDLVLLHAGLAGPLAGLDAHAAGGARAMASSPIRAS